MQTSGHHIIWRKFNPQMAADYRSLYFYRRNNNRAKEKNSGILWRMSQRCGKNFCNCFFYHEKMQRKIPQHRLGYWNMGSRRAYPYGTQEWGSFFEWTCKKWVREESNLHCLPRGNRFTVCCNTTNRYRSPRFYTNLKNIQIWNNDSWGTRTPHSRLERAVSLSS